MLHQTTALMATLALAACATHDEAPQEALLLSSTYVDNDRDNVDDRDEVAKGSDPTECLSVPMTHEAWGDCSRDGAEADHDPADEGWEMGDVTPEWSFTDQFGDTQSVRRWYGAVTLVVYVADW